MTIAAIIACKCYCVDRDEKLEEASRKIEKEIEELKAENEEM